MTKVQLTFKFSRPLAEDDYVSIARMHAVYGFLAVRLKPNGNDLFVEYDASRLTPPEVRAALKQQGLPLAPVVPPSGETAESKLAG